MDHTVNIRFLEGVAGMRFALKESANLLHYSQTDDQHTLICQAFQLIQVTEDVCTDPHINTADFSIGDAVGPAVYLLKLLARQYGFDVLNNICSKYPWVIPGSLCTSDQVSY